jgi:hypothetical protein
MNACEAATAASKAGCAVASIPERSWARRFVFSATAWSDVRRSHHPSDGVICATSAQKSMCLALALGCASRSSRIVFRPSASPSSEPSGPTSRLKVARAPATSTGVPSPFSCMMAIIIQFCSAR